MPILKVIFTAPERNSHHIYMALIILLILSEDDIFNKTIHNIVSSRICFITIIVLRKMNNTKCIDQFLAYTTIKLVHGAFVVGDKPGRAAHSSSHTYNTI